MTRNTGQMFIAGAAEADITPTPGTLINGDFVPHRATYIHDPLFVKAIFMQYGNTAMAMVVADTCVLSLEFAKQVRLQVATATGIPFEHICISVTHTHAAGSLSEVHLCAPDAAYSRLVPAKIVEAVQQAMQNAQPARIAFGALPVPEHVVCRRYIMKPGYYNINPVTGDKEQVITNPVAQENSIAAPAAITDPEVGYMALQDMNGNWIALLANYSMHYVGDWEHGTISSDYFGEFARQLRSKLPAAGALVTIMSNGSSGDGNCWDFRQPHRYPTGLFEISRFIAGDIAERVAASLPALTWEQDPRLVVQYDEVILGVRKPSHSEWMTAKALMNDTDYSNLIINDDTMRRIYAREQVLLWDYPDHLPVPLQVFRIGSGIIGCMAAEVFAETGLQIKAVMSAKKYFTVCLSNGNAGYIPPAYEIARGGYETWRCRCSCLQPESESLLRHRIIEMLLRTEKGEHS